ncbi:sulfurtransferase complex subunit TusC [Candidatus Enterovibrio escicola]|uniref:Protein TusC homolog n=1 Tax=Candidatus Enterovibrio escicola TaxID=1927127 RepID=A0A2A5T208_9GAMM|nr:sulfurtransferase complex subunit TusC [Candidatus Enterovibrio escacola]PCS22192.1 tRNA 5-methylaminomethyl-2-thiouridine synthase TusC [Candidatus Enterovibrio escacola]
MNKLGFVFSTGPHGTASGREGLDAVLAMSNFSEDIAVFFIGDGVMQLISGQQPYAVLCRDYISTFKILTLCDVDNIYVCELSLAERGLSNLLLIVDADIIPPDDISSRLVECRKVLQF